MKVRNLLSGFLAAIITVLVVVSLADGYANPDPEPPKVIAWDPEPGTVTAVELEKGIKCRFDKPVDNPEDLKIQVLADGYYPLKGWKVNWLDACTAIFTPGEISYDTGVLLKHIDEFGQTQEANIRGSWETNIELKGYDSFGYFFGHPEREYAVQYRSSDFNFITRLMEEEGVFYFFEYEENEVHVIADDRPIRSCTATLTALTTGKSEPVPCTQVDKKIFRLSIPPLQANTEFLLKLYLTDEDGNHGYCALTITTPK